MFYRLQDFHWKCFIWFWKTSISLISTQSASWAFQLFLVKGCSNVYYVTVMGQRHCQTFSLRLLTYLGCREAYGSSKERKYVLNYTIPALGNKGEQFSLKIRGWQSSRSFVIKGKRWVNWGFYILNSRSDSNFCCCLAEPVTKWIMGIDIQNHGASRCSVSGEALVTENMKNIVEGFIRQNNGWIVSRGWKREQNSQDSQCLRKNDINSCIKPDLPRFYDFFTALYRGPDINMHFGGRQMYSNGSDCF